MAIFPVTYRNKGYFAIKFMKNSISIFLIVIILFVSIVANILYKKEDKFDYSVDLENDYSEGDFSEGNIEISGGISSIYVEGLELLLEYLPPEAMLDYDDYMNIYVDGIKILLDDDEDFYNDNRIAIGNVFGIYNYEDYIRLIKIFDGVNVKDEVQSVKINDIKEENGVLGTKIEIHFPNKVISIKQVLDYVYVKNEPMLFIYTEI